MSLKNEYSCFSKLFNKITILIGLCFIYLITETTSNSCSAQILSKVDINQYASLSNYSAISSFYEIAGYHFVWANSKEKDKLLQYIIKADEYGLISRDYKIINTIKPLRQDSIQEEVLNTAAALHFLQDLHSGNHLPEFRYKGLDYNSSQFDLPTQLYAALKHNSFESLIKKMQPSSIEYSNALALLQKYLYIIKEDKFTEEKIKSNKVETSNELLVRRLNQLGYKVTSLSKKEDLINAIKKSQQQFNETSDGKLKSSTIASLNTPLKKRINQLKILLNFIRWSQDLKDSSSLLLLNIPSAEFKLYQNKKIIIDSKVIVGKKSTPTPTLTSQIDQVILYPYWMVPYKIATKELLPKIKRNINYLTTEKFEVINNQGKVVNSQSINWSSLSTGYFPYVLRQKTGCDNSLGLVKFKQPIFGIFT